MAIPKRCSRLLKRSTICWRRGCEACWRTGSTASWRLSASVSARCIKSELMRSFSVRTSERDTTIVAALMLTTRDRINRKLSFIVSPPIYPCLAHATRLSLLRKHRTSHTARDGTASFYFEYNPQHQFDQVALVLHKVLTDSVGPRGGENPQTRSGHYQCEVFAFQVRTYQCQEWREREKPHATQDLRAPALDSLSPASIIHGSDSGHYPIGTVFERGSCCSEEKLRCASRTGLNPDDEET